MPGIDIGAIMSTVGAMFMDALVNALTNTLTQLITGAISSIANSIAESVSGLRGPLGFIGDAISTFAHNLAAELDEATATLLNAVNAWAHDTIPILKNQQDLSNLIVGEVAEHVKALKDYLELQVQQQYKAGAAFTELLLRRLANREESLESIGRKLFELEQELVTGDAISKEKAINKATQWIMGYILADLSVIEEMGQEDLQYVSGYLNTLLQKRSEDLWVWFKDTVLGPVSMANALRSAFTEGVALTPDEYADMLLLHQEAVDKATRKYMERLEEELKEKGAT
ncbi:MAG: hypothetical protein DRN68_07940 [Thaumarchaeota archaeon]|nr:MAG: hypothetical protein DRN68_07940 [Nitrososphaerota archaeon]